MSIHSPWCFGGSSAKSNIVCVAMLVPQIKRICIIHMWRASPFRAHCHQLAEIETNNYHNENNRSEQFILFPSAKHLHISINSSSWKIRKKPIETIVLSQLPPHKKCRIYRRYTMVHCHEIKTNNKMFNTILWLKFADSVEILVFQTLLSHKNLIIE